MPFLTYSLAQWGKLAVTLASAAYTYYANKKMLKDKNRKPLLDDRPNTTTTRGAYVPLIIGRRRIAPIVAWLEGRRTEFFESSRGSTTQVRESAGHLLCVGPAKRLYRIYADGKIVFSQTLDIDSIPSGSTFAVTGGNDFTIYWGEENPPATGVPTNIGSEFPRICYIVWTDALLNGTLWPEYTYEIEVEAVDSGITTIQTRIVGQESTIGTYTDIGKTQNGFPGANYVETEGDRVDEFLNNQAVIQYEDTPSDFTLWDFVDSVAYDLTYDLNTIIANDSNRGARRDYTAFPGQGDKIRISFNYSFTGLALSPVQPVYNVIISVDGNEEYVFKGLERIGRPDAFQPTISDAITFSFYPLQMPPGHPRSSMVHLDIELTVDTDLLKNLTWSVRVEADANNTGVAATFWVGDYEFQGDPTFDVRQAFLVDSLVSSALPPDLTLWDEVDTIDGEIEYIDNADPDYQTPPAEATNAFQNRMDLFSVFVPERQVFSREEVTNYPDPGDVMEWSTYLKMTEGELIISTLDQPGTTEYWSATILAQSGLFSYVTSDVFTSVTLSTTTETDWIFVSIKHTIQPSESGASGLDFSVKVALQNTGQIPECWLNDFEFGDLSNTTRVELNEEVTFLIDFTGQIAPKTVEVEPGANAAGVIHQLLFEEYPYGANQDPALYDLQGESDSLTTISSLMAKEGLSLSIIADDGKTLEAILANILQDIGVMLFWDTTEGIFKFKAVRQPEDDDTITVLTDSDLRKRPVVQVDHDDAQTNQILFSFADRVRKYRESTLLFDDDGMVGANYGATKRSEGVRIPTVIDFNTANKIADRRSQEEMGKPNTYSIEAVREASGYNPGQSFRVSETGLLLRMISVKENPEGNDVTINAMSEIYGIPESISDITGDGGEVDPQPGPDLDFDLVEMPRFISLGSNTMIVLRIRESDDIAGANAHLSYDDSTFFADGAQPPAVLGGTLNQDLTPDTFFFLEEGPVINVEGPDILETLDLTGAEGEWRSGRQILYMGGEWFFLRNVTVLSSSQVRLNGLIRGRYASDRQSHAIGSRAYIFQDNDIASLVTLPPPGINLSLKTQPFNSFGSVDLSAVTSKTELIRGDGTRPLNPHSINTPGGQASYQTGEDIDLNWSYRTGASTTGAGDTGAGAPTAAASVEGTFTLSIYDSTNTTLIRTVPSLPSPDYTYTNADLQSDFSGEPAAFVVRVINISGSGQASDQTIKTITKV